MPSDHEQKMVNLTHQMRHNQSDLQSFLSDLDSWETDVKKKEEDLLSGRGEKKDTLPPVRNTLHKKKLKKKKKEKVVDPDKEKKKISGFDFRSWEKYDVDKALEEIEQEPKNQTSSSEYETDEEWEMERKLHLAGKEKEKGNAFLKNGEYDQAVEAYSRGMEFDATNALLPANRAMALLKQQKYAAAELDCTLSISLDPLYIKAYLRRATARANLNKTKEAIDDFNRVLDLEPTSKQAKTELERLQKEKERNEKGEVPSSLTDDERGRVKAIYKSPEERSKVPLKRIVIEEIGIETAKRHQHPLAEQSDSTKKITEMESKNFENILANSQTQTPKPKVTEIVKPPTEPSLSDKKDSAKRDEKKPDVKKAASEVKMNGNHSASPARSREVTTKDVASSEETTTIPNIPSSSFQFQTDFKLLKNNTKAFFQYFTAIAPSQFPKLFGQCLDADILKIILKTLLEHSDGTDVNVYDILAGLTRVQRFSMTTMFLSQKEKQSARELMEKISSSNACSSAELSSLRQKYDL